MEDSDEFKWAVKVVIKRQMRDLMDQLRERGEEIAILTVNLDDNSCSHFGSPNGEWFVSEQKNLTNNFLNFCRFKDKRAGGRSACSTPQKGAYSSPKAAKSSALNQKSTSDIASLRVTVPRQLAGDVSEEDLAGLVGRIVASQLAVQEKGDGSSGGTKFDLLVAAANRSRKKGDTGSNMSTPSTTRSTRKRKVSAKYREGMTSLKRGWKSEEDDTGSDQETGTEENVVISMLAELSTSVLRRVKVKTSDGIPVSLERSMLMSSVVLESLALLVVQELNDIAGGLLTKEKTIKLTVSIGDRCYSKVLVEVVDRVRMNLDEQDFDLKFEVTDGEDGDSDMEDISGLDENRDMGKEAKVENKSPIKLKKRPKRKPVLAKTTPFPCEHCGKKLIGRGNLVAHIKRVHNKLKDQVCNICSKGFYGAAALDSHMLAVHTRRCEDCCEYVIETVPWSEGTDMREGREVICQCGSVVHIYCRYGRKRVYESKEPSGRPKHIKYACQQCGKLFSTKSHCMRHARMHTGVKDIQCDFCNSTFRYKLSLKKHLQSAHKIGSQVCNICDLKFTSLADLEHHYRNKHGPDIGVDHEISESLDSSMVATVPVSRPTITVVAMPGSSSHTLQANEREHSEMMELSGSRVGVQVSTATMSRQSELDTEAFQLVQQALQGNRMLTEDGSTIIIRTLPN